MTTPATTTDAAAFARAAEFDRNVSLRAAEKAMRHPWGWAWWDRRFPQTWSMNALRVTTPLDPSVGVDEFVAEADRLHASSRHRFAFVEDDATGARLAPGLREQGFETRHEVLMALRAPRDREPAPGLAREAGEPEMQAVEIPSMLDEAELRDKPGSRAVAEEIIAARARMRAGLPRSRGFVAAWDGRDGAVATLYADGRTAQVEHVGTIPELRGHGLARAVVSTAVDAAVADAHDLVFLFADLDDWPRELYGKLGFREVGRAWAMVRPGA